MSAASINLSGDDQSLDSLATSSIGFSDLEDQSIDLRDDSLSSNIDATSSKTKNGNGSIDGGGGNKAQNRQQQHHRRSTATDLDVSTHEKANAAQAVASDLADEDQAVSITRCFVLLVLLVVAAFLGVATYWFLSEDLNEKIQQDVSVSYDCD